MKVAAITSPTDLKAQPEEQKRTPVKENRQEMNTSTPGSSKRDSFKKPDRPEGRLSIETNESFKGSQQ
jgi:hypothetical protein